MTKNEANFDKTALHTYTFFSFFPQHESYNGFSYILHRSLKIIENPMTPQLQDLCPVHFTNIDKFVFHSGRVAVGL